MTKSKTSNKLFSEIADELALSGSGMTRFIECPTYYLLINHQKSVYSKCFYINVGLIYKELLDRNFTADDIGGAFNIKNPTAPVHVVFRIGRFPSAPPDLEREFDRLIAEGAMSELKEILMDALKRLLVFIGDNHDRKTIRKLYDEKKLSAGIRKEV